MSQAAAVAPSPNAASAELIGCELQQALGALRLQSLSLHDADGDVVWLSEGTLGPDEHVVVLEAMSAHSLEAGRPIIARALGDGRDALILPARTANGDIVGAAMILIDSKLAGPALLPKLATAAVRDALAKLAARHSRAAKPEPPAAAAAATPSPAAPRPAPAASRPAPAAATPSPAAPRPAPAAAPPAPAAPRPAPAAATPSAAAARPTAAAAAAGSPSAAAVAAREAAAAIEQDRLLSAAAAKVAAAARVALAKQKSRNAVIGAGRRADTAGKAAPAAAKAASRQARTRPPSPAPKAPAATVDSDATVIAPKPEMPDLSLVVQQLLKLRSGGRTRRYEVLLRSRKDPARDAVPASVLQAISASDSNSGIDRYVLTELVTWLGKHPQVWDSDPTSFTLNLAIATLRDESFIGFASTLFQECKVPPAVVGFEIPERACIEAANEVRRFAESCEKLGCFIALDDFSMHSSAVPLLASPCLRLAKIDARLTAAAMNDKLSQALVIAISQASKVLGVHAVAKRIESSVARQWLSAIGIDFAQGFALERPQLIDALLELPSEAQAAKPS